jgi:hypothetical protein
MGVTRVTEKHNPHIGSKLDEFLREVGLLEELQGQATKEVIAWQVAEVTMKRRVSKTNLPKKICRVSRSQSIRIASVKYAGEYTLRIGWENGTSTSVDLREPVLRLKGMRPIRDMETFAHARRAKGGHSVFWPDEIDVGAERLWEMSLEQNA